MKKTKKIFSVALAVLLFLSALTLLSSAENDECKTHSYKYGVCESCHAIEDGYTAVYTKGDLDRVRENLRGKYVLMNDIVFTDSDFEIGGAFYNGGAGWLPIGCDFDFSAYYYEFTGVFNGNGYSIKNVKMNRTPTRMTAYPEQTEYVNGADSFSFYTPHSFGLFAINAGKILNLDLAVDYTVNTDPYAVVGAICGVNMGYISDCSTDGTISAIKEITSGDSDFGGVSGWLAGGTIIRCKSDVDISAVNKEPYAFLNCGGIIGATAGDGECSIHESFNTGTILTESPGYIAGICARSTNGGISKSGLRLVISNCYNAGTVGRKNGGAYIAGIAAEHFSGLRLEINHCYNVGKLVSTGKTAGILQTNTTYNNTVCENAYYLDTTADGIICSYSSGRAVVENCFTDDQMRIEGAYRLFDFEGIWIIVANSGYPYPQLRGNFQTDTTHTSHHFEERIEKQPTCTEVGYGQLVCSECSYVSREIELDKIPHLYEVERVVPPTCKNGGYTVFTCACGDSFDGEFLPTVPHNYTASVTTPTCTDSGYTTYTCKCGHTYVDNIVASLGHNYTASVTTPTCTDSGYTTYTCECGDTRIDNVINPTGHSFDDGRCKTCGEPDPTGCSCNCHAGGLRGFFFKIKNFFERLFGRNQICDCGRIHYYRRK